MKNLLDIRLDILQHQFPNKPVAELLAQARFEIGAIIKERNIQILTQGSIDVVANELLNPDLESKVNAEEAQLAFDAAFATTLQGNNGPQPQGPRAVARPSFRPDPKIWQGITPAERKDTIEFLLKLLPLSAVGGSYDKAGKMVIGCAHANTKELIRETTPKLFALVDKFKFANSLLIPAEVQQKLKDYRTANKTLDNPHEKLIVDTFNRIAKAPAVEGQETQVNAHHILSIAWTFAERMAAECLKRGMREDEASNYLAHIEMALVDNIEGGGGCIAGLIARLYPVLVRMLTDLLVEPEQITEVVEKAEAERALELVKHAEAEEKAKAAAVQAEATQRAEEKGKADAKAQQAQQAEAAQKATAKQAEATQRAEEKAKADAKAQQAQQAEAAQKATAKQAEATQRAEEKAKADAKAQQAQQAEAAQKATAKQAEANRKAEVKLKAAEKEREVKAREAAEAAKVAEKAKAEARAKLEAQAKAEVVAKAELNAKAEQFRKTREV